MAHILITGDTGFTGKYLYQKLIETGHLVTRFRTDLSCDLLDFARMSKVFSEFQFDFVVHLAAISNVRHSNFSDFYNVNVTGSINLIEALLLTQTKLSRVLVASTGNLYFPNSETLLTEESLIFPVNHYANSKFLVEKALELYRNDLSIIFVRSFNYTGLGQGHEFLIPKIVSAFARREDTLVLGNLDIVRDFSDVRAVVDAYARLIETSEFVPVVNVCSNVGYSIREILKICETITSHNVSIEVNQEFVRKNDPASLVGSNERLCKLLPEWKTIPLRETLEWMLL